MMKFILVILFVLNSFGSIFSQNNLQYIDDSLSNELFSLGLEFFNNDDFDKARYYFEYAIEKNPNNFKPHVGLAGIYRWTGEYELSVAHATKGLNLFSENEIDVSEYYWDLFQLRAVSSIYLKNYEQAISDLTVMINYYDKDYYLYYLIATAFLETNELQKADEAIKRAYELNPESSGVLFAYGLACFKKGDDIQAIKYLSEAKKLKTLESLDPAVLYYLGMSYYFTFEFEKAIHNFELFLNHNSHHLRDPFQVTQAELKLGLLYSSYKEWNKSIPLLIKSLEVNSSCQLCYFSLALAYFATGQLDKAEDVIEISLSKFPGDGVFELNKGTLLMMRGDFKQSRIHLQKAYDLGIQHVTDTTLFYSSLTERAYFVGDTLLALNSINKAIHYNPTSASLYDMRISIYTSNQDKYLHNILDDVDKLLELFSENTEILAYYHAYRAALYVMMNKLEKGMSEINYAIELDSFPEYFAYRGFLKLIQLHHVMQNKEDEHIELSVQNDILEDIETALLFNHRKKDAYILHTSILAMFERNEEACKSAQEAIKLGATFDEAILNYMCNLKKVKQKTLRNTYLEDEYYLTGFKERFPDWKTEEQK